MRVFLSSHGADPLRMRAYEEALDVLAPRYRRSDSPAAADVVLYTEPGDNKFRAWLRTLVEDSVISDYPEKCFVYEFSDRPVAFLAGLYVSQPRDRIDWLRMRPADRWTAVELPAERELLANTQQPTLLFSFRGSESAGVRSQLFKLDLGGTNAKITQTYRWWDYGDPETDLDRRTYLNELRDSCFVLCPRGLSPSTYRVYETMQLGRVPVILADAWEPPLGPPWRDFSIRIAESKAGQLPDILERHRSEASDMGRLARDAWEHWMRPGPVLMHRWLQAIDELIEMRPAGWKEAEQHRRWHTHRFLLENQIHPVQGLISRIRTRSLRFGDVVRFVRGSGTHAK